MLLWVHRVPRGGAGRLLPVFSPLAFLIVLLRYSRDGLPSAEVLPCADDFLKEARETLLILECRLRTRSGLSRRGVLMATSTGKIRRTAAQLAADGFAAIVQKLGMADAVRYVHLFHQGAGDEYAWSRHAWLDEVVPRAGSPNLMAWKPSKRARANEKQASSRMSPCDVQRLGTQERCGLTSCHSGKIPFLPGWPSILCTEFLRRSW